MQYGDPTIDKEWAASYEGTWNNGSTAPSQQSWAAHAVSWLPGELMSAVLRLLPWLDTQGRAVQMRSPAATRVVRQREADLVPLLAQASMNAPHAGAALQAALAGRRRVDDLAAAAVGALLRGSAHAAAALRGLVERGSGGSAAETPRTSGELMSAIISGHHGRPAPGLPLVDSWDCLRAMVAAWQQACGPLDQYGMRHTRLFANLCNAGLQPAQLGDALSSQPTCA